MKYCDLCARNKGGECELTGERVEPLTLTDCPRWERWRPTATDMKEAEEEIENQLKLFDA